MTCNDLVLSSKIGFTSSAILTLVNVFIFLSPIHTLEPKIANHPPMDQPQIFALHMTLSSTSDYLISGELFLLLIEFLSLSHSKHNIN